MTISLIDVIIIFSLLLGFLVGYRRGVVRQGVLTLGILLVVTLSFLFKNPLSMMLYKHLPFYTIGLLKNYSILNILLYELISFFLLFSLFTVILAIIVKISGVVEQIVRFTIILAVPSKILGGVMGVIENYIICFIVLLVVTMPIFSFSTEDFVSDSKLKDIILTKTLVLSNISGGLIDSINSINDLLENKEKIGTKKFNCKTLDIFIKNEIVSEDSVDYLKKSNKIEKNCKKK